LPPGASSSWATGAPGELSLQGAYSLKVLALDGTPDRSRLVGDRHRVRASCDLRHRQILRRTKGPRMQCLLLLARFTPGIERQQIAIPAAEFA
jgi:hypothetical protein